MGKVERCFTATSSSGTKGKGFGRTTWIAGYMLPEGGVGARLRLQEAKVKQRGCRGSKQHPYNKPHDQRSRWKPGGRSQPGSF